MSRQHLRALNHLRYGIKERKGFIVVSGGVGTGKTTLCRALLNELDASVKTAFVFNTSLSDIELLETINQEFGIPVEQSKRTKRALVDSLNRFLLKTFKTGRNAVLLIDEAQNLSSRALEQLRMLSNLETDREKLIQIVLVGQRELTRLLESPGLRQLNDRITVRFHLNPLDRQEVRDYIEHRLIVAGNHGKVSFTKGAIKAVYAYSHGNPRRINAICDRSLLIAYCMDEFVISRNTVHRAVTDLRGGFSEGARGVKWLQSRLAPAAAVALMAFIVANLGGWNLNEKLSNLSSAFHRVAAVQSKAFVHQEIPSTHSSPASMVRKPIVEQPDVLAPLVLSDRESLAALFRLFNVQDAQKTFAMGEAYPSLFSYQGDPALYRLFVRPFRIRVKSAANAASASYLVVTQVTQDGAIVLDRQGASWIVAGDFILDHWDGEMSWVYPCDAVNGEVSEGASGAAVLKLQQILQDMGYPVEPRGVFDRNTLAQVMRYQLDVGLKADGVIGASTRALLYEMAQQA